MCFRPHMRVSMINIHTEQLRSLAEAARELPRQGNSRGVHVSTLCRWWRHGVQCGVQGRVKLETVVIGGRRYTSVEAIQRFVERLNAAKKGSAPSPKATASSQRRAEQVERE